MAGVITCPMDVVKTRIQTELDPEMAEAARQKKQERKQKLKKSTKATSSNFHDYAFVLLSFFLTQCSH